MVLGSLGGYKGLVEDYFVVLDVRAVSNIVYKAGTILLTDRYKKIEQVEYQQVAVDNCKKLNAEAVVCIGGDGTFRGAVDLTNLGLLTICIPGTIDNDMTVTDYTIGFDTAMNSVLACADRLRDTCESHARCNVIEVMGRDCGEIALETAIALGAAGCAIPEESFDEDALIEKMHAMQADGKRNLLVIISEGMPALKVEKQGVEFDVPYAEVLTKKLIANGFDAKFCRLAHIVRGGSPTLRDRTTASKMGAMAIDLIEEGKKNRVIIEKNGALQDMDVNFALATDKIRKNKIKAGDLDRFTAEEVAQMNAYVEAYKKSVSERYEMFNELAR
jgi:6-phosphofructokinase 1